MNPVLALIITNIIWGAAPPIFKFALGNIPPFTLAFSRFFLAALLFVPALFLFKHPQLTKRDYIEIFLGTLVGIVFHIGFFFLGLERTASINSAVIGSSGPVFLYFLSILFLKEKSHSKILVGMLIALSGALVILVSPILLGHTGARGSSEVTGNIYLLLSTLALAIDVLIFKDILKRVRSIIATFWSFAFASICFFPLALIELQSWSFSELNFNGVVGIVFGALFSSGIAFLFFYYSIRRIKGQEIGLYAYIGPVVTVLIAIPLLGEYPNIYFFIGSVLVFSGIVIAEKKLHWHPFHKLRVHHYGKSTGGEEV